jgi:glyoxylase-like metal-dependent hydrolase (beta-lactamase superfamily II)
MRADKVKEGLYVIRGPFLPCMTGCRPGQTGDGLIHESGDVAVRVTPAGLIVVDDKFASQAADVLARIKSISPQPIKYLLNSHHHGDHASGNAYMRESLGIDIIAHRNIRENFLRIKQAGEPNITFSEQSAIYLGGVEVQLYWFGRGHTNGDTVIYLPKEKIVCTGDLMESQIAYMGDAQFDEWVTTLGALKKLDFDTDLPGHGAPFRGKDLITAFQGYLTDLMKQGAALRQQGVSADAMASRVDLTAYKTSFPQIQGPGVDTRGARRLYEWMDEKSKK